jgi:hypothetical protein
MMGGMKRRQRQGLGLMDLLFALGLLGVLLSVLQTGEIALRHQILTLERRARVLFLAQEYMELSRPELPYRQPASWQSKLFEREDGIRAVMFAQPWDSNPHMRLITIQVTWKDPEGGPEHQLVLTRLVPDRVSPEVQEP